MLSAGALASRGRLLWWLLFLFSLARPSQLHPVKRFRHSIDQLACDIRDIAGIDLFLLLSDRNTERASAADTPLQIPPFPLNHINHSSFKDVLLRLFSAQRCNRIQPRSFTGGIHAESQADQSAYCGG